MKDELLRYQKLKTGKRFMMIKFSAASILISVLSLSVAASMTACSVDQFLTLNNDSAGSESAVVSETAKSGNTDPDKAKSIREYIELTYEPVTDDYDEGVPSAMERFRKSLANFSAGVVDKVRSIPRRAWRITALVLCAILSIAFIAWSIGKLYQATTPTDSAQQPEKPAESVPAVAVDKPTASKDVPNQNVKQEPKVKAKPAQASAKTGKSPAKPGTLISTGQNVPNLFVD